MKTLEKIAIKKNNKKILFNPGPSSLSAENLRQSGEQAQLGGLLSAELTLARRGVI